MGFDTPDTWQELVREPISTAELFGDIGTKHLVLNFLEFDYEQMKHVPRERALVVAEIADEPYPNPDCGMTRGISCPVYPSGLFQMARDAFGDGEYAGTVDYTVDGVCYLGRHRAYFTRPEDGFEVDMTSQG
jgi:hypothetical protein